MKFRKPVRYEDPMPINEGICRGGPWDGHRYAHANKTFTVAMLDCKKWPVIYDSEVTATSLFGEYRHVAGQWIWHEGSQH